MFYTDKVLFIHPVRVGGTWLTDWAVKNLPAVSVDRHYLKHANRPRLQEIHPDFGRLEAFTIVRDEEERFRSYLRLCREFDLTAPRDWTEGWEGIVRASRELSEVEFRRGYFPRMAGYLQGVARRFPFEPGLVSCVEWLRAMHGV